MARHVSHTARSAVSHNGRSAGPNPLVGPVEPPSIHVMTWNIRRPLPPLFARSVDRWDRRAPLLAALLADERPTILGAQEVVAEQADVVRAALGESYRYVGRGRDADGGGEAGPIFYDSGRLDLVDWEQTALSDTPARAGSVGWGNLFPRVMVSATFSDRATSRRFLMVNTHLDPLSGRSRVRAARAIREHVAARSLPAVVTGDLNAGPGSAAVRELLSEGVLSDAWHRADARLSDEWGTYTGYRDPRVGGARIDWILVSSAFAVTRAAIDHRRHAGGWASDHLPVHAVLGLDQGRGEAP